jgi:hypothetical protein
MLKQLSIKKDKKKELFNYETLGDLMNGREIGLIKVINGHLNY